jgi:hypothetical protein
MCSKLLIRRRKAVLFKLKEFPTWQHFQSYKKEEAMAKSGLRKIKREYFKKFNSISQQYTSQSYIWEKVSKLLKNMWNCRKQPNKYKERKL